MIRLKIVTLSILLLIGELTLLAQSNYKGGNLIIEAGGMLGMQKFNMRGGSVGAIGGYTFNEFLFVGGGITINYYYVDDFDALSIPLFGRIKYTLFKSKITPFISADIGVDPVFIYVVYDIKQNYDSKYEAISVDRIQGTIFCISLGSASCFMSLRESVLFSTP